MATDGLQGSKEILENLKKLKGDQTIGVFKKAGKSAMQSVVDDAKRRARALNDSETPSSIEPHIDAIVIYKNDELVVSVGVRGGARYRRGDKARGLVTYWRYVELGTENAPAQPFLRPALAENQQQVFERFIQELGAEITKRL
ncbi:hypothetical protein HOP61_13290 [Halomonas daqingensis]|uniref:HK97 gp10 family phage protein n=1 Tax=Billgrantia desiderata TaxID=52021 RepID=A0AAW4YV51_9GAMM|nr:HK97-gp10 family putative phage morphogenesis protein [Halomonas desiderata]MCE8052279.1 hypothetical protein [Halomonas desiderata]